MSTQPWGVRALPTSGVSGPKKAPKGCFIYWTWGEEQKGRRCCPNIKGFVVLFWLLSCVWLFATPWTVARRAPLPSTFSRSLLRFMSIESVMPSNHLTFSCPFYFCLQSSPASGSFPMSQLFLKMLWTTAYEAAWELIKGRGHRTKRRGNRQKRDLNGPILRSGRVEESLDRAFGFSQQK